MLQVFFKRLHNVDGDKRVHKQCNEIFYMFTISPGKYIITRKFAPLWGPTSSSCGGAGGLYPPWRAHGPSNLGQTFNFAAMS